MAFCPWPLHDEPSHQRSLATPQALTGTNKLGVWTETRVLRRLTYLAHIYANHPVKAIPLTQDDLAFMAGTTRQTVNRVLGHAQGDGLLSLSRGRIVITDRVELGHRAKL